MLVVLLTSRAIAAVAAAAAAPAAAAAALPALLAHDAAVALAAWAVYGALRRRPRVRTAIHAALCLWIAVNVPVTIALSSPLTVPMLRAARGAMADSIAHHLTAAALLQMGLVLAAALVSPVLLARSPRRGALVLLAAAAGIVLAAAVAGGSRGATYGAERNAVTALLGSLARRAPPPRPASSAARHRVSPFAADAAPDSSSVAARLASLRGAARDRSVLLVVLESTGAEHLGIHGASPDPMPFLSSLAADAVVFDAAYCAYPESIRGLLSLLCGTDPSLGAAVENLAAERRPSLASELGARGRATGLFHSGRFGYLSMDAVVRDRGFDTLEDAGAIGGREESSFGVDDVPCVDRLLEWIDGLPAPRRYFACYLPTAGHHPYQTPPPRPFPDSSDLERYRNALHYGDHALERLVAGLRARGLWEESLVVIAGDHGQAFGRHPGNYGHSLHLWEENVRVPLLIAIPGRLEGQIRAGAPASLVDVAPTVLDLLGEAPESPFPSTSLLDSPPGRMALFVTDYSLALAGLRDGRWKCIHEPDSGRTLLFDLDADPLETRDVAAANAVRARVYTTLLREWTGVER